jgi:hypothetical protein
VTCQTLPPNTDGYRRYCPFTVKPNATGTYYGPDLAKARKLVAASGTHGQPVTIWFYDIPVGRRNGAYFVSVLQSLQGQAPDRPAHGSNLAPRPSGRRRGLGRRLSLGKRRLLHVHVPLLHPKRGDEHERSGFLQPVNRYSDSTRQSAPSHQPLSCRGALELNRPRDDQQRSVGRNESVSLDRLRLAPDGKRETTSTAGSPALQVWSARASTNSGCAEG